MLFVGLKGNPGQRLPSPRKVECPVNFLTPAHKGPWEKSQVLERKGVQRLEVHLLPFPSLTNSTSHSPPATARLKN